MKARIVCSFGSALLLVGTACSGDGGGGTGTPDPGAIAGRVASGTENVSAASVAISGPANRSATTNASGEYRFDNLAAGSYTATLTVPTGFELAGGESEAKPAAVQAGQTTTVNWELEPTGGNGGANVVRLLASSFDPAEIRITVGETVTWRGESDGHTVTPDNADQDGAWVSFGLNNGQEGSHTFNTVGTFEYHCVPHAALGMRGTVIVEAE